jgi:GNAT superfamily N-acetyltransferase
MDLETGGAAPKDSMRLDVVAKGEGLAQLLALLNAAFEVPAGSSFYDDFPVWDPRHGAGVFRLGAFAADRLVAAAMVRLAELKAPGGDLTVALIGGVATDPSWRGRGLASRLVPLAVEWAKERSAALALLWGSEHSLYQRLGFELCGEQARVPLASLRRYGKFPELEAGSGWSPSLFKCLEGRPGGIRLRRADRIWMRAHRNVSWRWLGDPRAPRAYAAVGRGIDLQGLVHEWGGEREALAELLARLEAETPGLQLLGGPGLFNQYGIQFDESRIEYLCMARVLDPRAVLAAYRPGIGRDALARVPASGDRLVARMFFGPGARDSEICPLPLWVWGLDGC